MRPGKPLNPYAESFTPLCIRGREEENATPTHIVTDIKKKDETVKFEQVTENRGNDVTSVDSENHVNIVNASSEDSTKEKVNIVEDFELDLAYLSAIFPALSEQSLADVYFATDSDLEASIEMLSQLELPDAFDFGDMSDFRDVAETSAKEKTTVTGEASGSCGSSGVSLGFDQQ